MNAWRAKRVTGPNEGMDRGFTLIETLVALVIVLVVAGGMATVYGVSIRSNALNSAQVQLLNSARAKVEQIQSIPYEQVGINASGVATGPGYFVVDPIYTPTYAVANGDSLLSDTVTLKNGLVVTRTVTVEAVDDPIDGTGVNDSDGVIDPNTQTILDYKLLTVTASTTVSNFLVTQVLTNILQGSLPTNWKGVGTRVPPSASSKVGSAARGHRLRPPHLPIVALPPDAKDAKGREPLARRGAVVQSSC